MTSPKISFFNEQGWFLMDAVALGFILVALAGMLGMYRTTLCMRQSTLMRTAACHLAETQCSHLEEQAYAGRLPEGEVPWLGQPGDLSQNGISLTVETSILPLEPPMRQILIKVSWKLHGKEEFVRIERRLREYEETPSPG